MFVIENYNMQQITDKNIRFYFADLIDFANKIQNQEIKNTVYDLLNFISESKKTTNKEKLKFASDISKIIMEETGGGINTIIASVLFSFFDKNEIDIILINEKFGVSISKILDGLLKIPNLRTEKIDKQAEKFIKLLLTITGDVRAILIMLANELYKIRNIDTFSEEEKIIIVYQSKTLFTPLAHRIGLYNIKTEFEEKTMKYLEPEMYRFIAKKLQETKAKRDVFVEDFINPIKKILKTSGYRFTVKGRPKSIHSIWAKMKNQNVPFEEVYDLFAIRIILMSDIKNEKTVCWNVYSIITDLYKPNPKRLRDWISAPKISGYESLHTTVLGYNNKWVEVQIRTERMDEVAEKGPAAHWRYKTGKEGGNSDWLADIREAIENAENFSNETESKSKTELYSDEVLVFTPEGDLKSLKKGYTILDFAFSIHTKIGISCTGAIVNGIIQSLAYELVNGDTVKVLTNKNKKPNSEWLKIAKSSRTKSKIKRALKALNYNRAESGKEIIKEKLDRLKIDFSEKNIATLTIFFKAKNTVDFYNRVGEGIIDIAKIKQAFEKSEESEIEIKQKSEVKNFVQEKIEYDDFLLIDENISGLDYSFSKCCSPLPGDDVFGFVTVNKGTRIHKKTCPNAKDMTGRFPYRVVKAKWNIDDIATSFSVNIVVLGKDMPGISSKITDIISKEFNLKLMAISLKNIANNMFKGLIVVKISNKKQLFELLKRIKMIKGVNNAFQK